jgi:glycosyltransferase involved in cell wall biosynthesis
MVTANNISITSPSGLVSIVIPCCGMLDYTKLCVPSVLRHSREPFELIALDIGSLDGTAEYLAGLRDGLANRVRVEVCRAATDLNIPAKARQEGFSLVVCRDLFIHHPGTRTFAHGAPASAPGYAGGSALTPQAGR